MHTSEFISSAQCQTILTNCQEKFIPARDAELFCRIIGQGDPIIIIHGGAGYTTQDYLLQHLTRLSKHNLVIFYDQRGLGRSTGEINLEQINIKTYIEDIEAIRNFLGVKKISLLGHSWGGFLGMHYAISYPESIEKLILVGTMPASSEDIALFFTELTKRLLPYQEELQKIESSDLYLSGDPETVSNDLRIIYQTYMYDPKNVSKLNLSKTQKSALNGFKVWDILREQVFMQPFNLFEDISKLQCKALIIHGDCDPIPFNAAENIQKAIPHSSLIKIDQCGHFPFVEQPESFFKEIEEFLYPVS